MSQDYVERLLGRLLTDVSFRAKAAVSMAKACYQEGYTLSAGELRLVSRIDTSVFDTVADHLDPDLCRAALPPRKQFPARKKAAAQEHEG